jgi:Neuraminidase (sialidase)
MLRRVEMHERPQVGAIMQELRPVAWRYQHEEKPELVNVTDVRLNSETRNPLYEESPLYALPDTHRIVPVEFLEDIARDLERGKNALSIAETLRAIIDKEPT